MALSAATRAAWPSCAAPSPAGTAANRAALVVSFGADSALFAAWVLSRAVAAWVETLYVATRTASAPRAAATAFSTVAASGAVPVDRAVAVKPRPVRVSARTEVGGPVVPEGDRGSAPTTRISRCVRGDSGSVPFSLLSRVVVASAMRSAAARWAAVPTTASTSAAVPAMRSGCAVPSSVRRPARAFRRRTRRTDSSTRSSVSSPSATARSTAFHATSGRGGFRSWSTPALSARTATRSSPYFVRTPRIARESVATTPS
ncbi:hypothetical protein SALBM135S_02415 [Streptomyces alboniger]